MTKTGYQGILWRLTVTIPAGVMGIALALWAGPEWESVATMLFGVAAGAGAVNGIGRRA